MVSPPHEAMHRIFQHDPGLFSRVSRLLGIAVPSPAKVTVMPTDLTETSPVERRVDTLLRLESAELDAFLPAIEAQGKQDPAKPASWAYYVSYVWTKYRLPTALLVVCQDHATARWAEQSVSSGPRALPTLTLRPVVIGPHNVPMITDPVEARADLVLATLSAITHAANPDIGAILKALSSALQDVPENLADPVVELTAQGLGNRPAKDLWRNLVAVDLSFYKSWLSEEIREEGREKGRAEGLAGAVLRILEQRGLHVSDEARTRIMSSDDPELLDHWLTRAVTTPSVEEIFESQ
ncbi:hypothetical protein [Streptomyces sp. TS71-3]|uniref:hypothetical protein n=1 Tax=Streptomyces sp. TS71-3 TaxID=2733862 RepID=UPI001B2A95CA|nr:hypothetical protein [Streptomyces sp. TS71-3]GHJ35970.1 hypothetical protein Sm713_15790 [Streptomyces sp. TS71-3]